MMKSWFKEEKVENTHTTEFKTHLILNKFSIQTFPTSTEISFQHTFLMSEQCSPTMSTWAASKSEMPMKPNRFAMKRSIVLDCPITPPSTYQIAKNMRNQIYISIRCMRSRESRMRMTT